jgi:hypothetical protein
MAWDSSAYFGVYRGPLETGIRKNVSNDLQVHLESALNFSIWEALRENLVDCMKGVMHLTLKA